jgi:hypothetical protein
MQMWVYDGHRVYLDIDGGIWVMREWEENLIESYKMCKVTYIVLTQRIPMVQVEDLPEAMQ